MSHKTLTIALVALATLSFAQDVRAQGFVETSVRSHGAILQSNTGSRANLDTMIGSADVRSGDHVKTDVNLNGDVAILNSGSRAEMDTKIGSVASGSKPNFLDGAVDVLKSAQPGSYETRVNAEDILIKNTGSRAEMKTAIGSIEGDVKRASTDVSLYAPVSHINSGSRASSNLSIGSVR